MEWLANYVYIYIVCVCVVAVSENEGLTSGQPDGEMMIHQWTHQQRCLH